MGRQVGGDGVRCLFEDSDAHESKAFWIYRAEETGSEYAFGLRALVPKTHPLPEFASAFTAPLPYSRAPPRPVYESGCTP